MFVVNYKCLFFLFQVYFSNRKFVTGVKPNFIGACVDQTMFHRWKPLCFLFQVYFSNRKFVTGVKPNFIGACVDQTMFHRWKPLCFSESISIYPH